MAEDNCKYHIDHENRITNNTKDIRELQMNYKNPAITVAVIGGITGIFTGTMAFLAVIVAPVIRAWLGV